MNFSLSIVQDESVETVKKFQPRNTEVGDFARLMCSKSSEILRRTGAVHALRTHPILETAWMKTSGDLELRSISGFMEHTYSMLSGFELFRSWSW